MRLTLAQVKESRIPQVLGICADDPRVVDYVNEAQERLLGKGTYWGTYSRYAICTVGGCVTWPRQIASIQAITVCGSPVNIRNEWYEFIENCVGQQDADSCNTQLIDRGVFCTFNDIIPTTDGDGNQVGKMLKVYCDVAEDSDQYIRILGYDENNNWIRTQVDGEWEDGELILLSTTAQYSIKTFSSITGIIKPITNGVVRLYEVTVDDPEELRSLGIYEPDETVPAYRRSLLTGLGTNNEDEKTVIVVAKLSFVKVRNDTDFLLITSIPALKDMVMSIKKRENGDYDASDRLEASAVMELERQLLHYVGGASVPLSIKTDAGFGGCGVPNAI